MDSFDYWRLCDELTIIQAALLIAGEDPSSTSAYVENWDVEDRPIGYGAARTALSNALERDQIQGCLVFHDAPDGALDIFRSTVIEDSLRRWLSGRGLKTGFFFPEEAGAPDYLDTGTPRYAPKLAAAVRAWQAMSDSARTDGKSPKQALTKWLREHAAEFGLTGEDGKPNETGIEEVAKVANWQLTGGAPKTPG